MNVQLLTKLMWVMIFIEFKPKYLKKAVKYRQVILFLFVINALVIPLLSK